IFEIDNNDTVIDLNIKCNKAAIKSFIKLVDKLIHDRLQYKTQNLAKRSYVAKNKKPIAGAVFQWDNTAEEIYALFRSLHFYPFDNPVSTPKVMIGNDLYICDKMSVGPQINREMTSGVVLTCDSEQLIISTSSYPVIIEKLSTIDGKEIRIEEVIKKHQLHKSLKLNSHSDITLKAIRALDQRLQQYESFWISKLEKVQLTTLPNWKPNKCVEQYPKSTTVGYPKGSKEFMRHHGYDELHTFLTLVIIYLTKITRQLQFSVAYLSKALHDKIKDKESYFESFVPFNISIDDNMTFSELYLQVRNQKEILDQNIGYTRDIKRRRRSLHQNNKAIIELSNNVAINEFHSFSKTGLTAQLEFSFNAESNNVWGQLRYQPDKISEKSVIKVNGHFNQLFMEIISDPSLAIDAFPFTAQEENYEILNIFNKKPLIQCPYSLVELFRRQTKLTPKNIALAYEKETLTYEQLYNKSEEIASYIVTIHQIKANDIVALITDRNQWMIISILGVLISGAAYLPIAQNAPIRRTEFMLKEAKAKLILTDKINHNKVVDTSISIPIIIIEYVKHTVRDLSDIVYSPSNLAYVLYTSGSTGQPKGAMIQHAGICNLIKYQIDQFQITAKDRILQFSTYTFDTSVEEIFLALLSGAALILADINILLSPSKFEAHIKENKITVLDLPPSFLDVIFKRPLHTVRIMILGGESPKKEHIDYYEKRLTLINSYGPTEATIVVTNHIYNGEPTEVAKQKLIGKPIKNTEILILDSYSNLMPVGVVGELCISGENIMRGYISNNNADNLIEHPWRSGEKIYRTGDLARWLNDGNIEYIGRIDNQVKLRGQRIELGEIESILSKHPDITDNLVVLKKNPAGFHELIAYIVATDIKNFEASRLKSYLKKHLPSYMLPSAFVTISQIPKKENVFRKTKKLALQLAVIYIWTQT
ncbi:MAG: amino acid adenylation domain-containing protein, partial [Saprospiraceae bacterium]|nr:amino acid adenylation domain-containing protein [Saprospiraceae bacterium]